MSRVAGGKSGHFQIVMDQLIGSGKRVVLSAEKLLLVVVAGTPSEYASNIERLALNLAPHVLGQNSLCRILIMRTPGGVNVMISGIPAELRRINPSLQLEGQLRGALLTHRELPCLREI